LGDFCWVFVCRQNQASGRVEPFEDQATAEDFKSFAVGNADFGSTILLSGGFEDRIDFEVPLLVFLAP
jgi:hypothetical protein